MSDVPPTAEKGLLACESETYITVEREDYEDEKAPWELVVQCNGTGNQDCGFRLVIEEVGHVSDLSITTDDVNAWHSRHQAHARVTPPEVGNHDGA